MKHAALLFAVSIIVATAPTTSAQEAPTTRPSGPSQKIRWPDDEGRVVCIVDGVEHTVGDLIDYLEQQHWPGLRGFLELPAGRLYFESPLPARWVRQYADVVALRNEAEQRGIPRAESNAALSAALKRGFEKWLDLYTERRAQTGRPIERLDQDTINSLLTRFQNEFGLETELGGWLSVFVPVTPLEAEGVLREYYQDHARFFGGSVTISHILVRNRDPHTGELLVGDPRRAFLRRLADVESRLADDGSNFEAVARRLSEDRMTASDGGIMRNITRFDDRLPTSIRRAAWHAIDGEVVGPFESEFGVHFVKRLSYMQMTFALYTERLKPEIVRIKEQHEREDLLFAVRAKHGVDLKY